MWALGGSRKKFEGNVYGLEKKVISAILKELNPTAADKEYMFYFLGFLVYSSNGSGFILPAKPRWNGWRATSQQCSSSHPHTTFQVG